MTIPIGFGQVTFEFSGSGVPTGAAVVIGFDNNTSQSPTELAAVFSSLWDDSLSNQQMVTTRLVNTRVKFGPDDLGPSGEFGSDIPGSLAGTAAPPQVAGLITKTTNLGGREGRGRMYLPGLRETQINEAGLIDTAYLDEIQNVANIFLEDMESNLIPMVVLHRSETAPTVVEALSVQAQVATQRGRNRR